MPRVVVDFSQAGEGGGFDRVPAGLYRLRCTKAALQRSQSGPGSVIWTEWIVRGPSSQGAKLLRVFSLQPQAAWSLRNCLTAIGFKVPQAKANIDTDALVGKEVAARILDGEMTSRTNGQKRAISDIKEFLSLADYEMEVTPTRSGAPSIAQATQEVAALEEDFEYSDPEEKADEEEAEEVTL